MTLRLNNGETISFDDCDKKYMLAKLLYDAMIDLGHPLSYQEAHAYPGLPEYTNIYATEFGSLDRACELAGHLVGSRERPQDYEIRNEMTVDERAERSIAIQIRRIDEHGLLKEVIRRMNEEKREEILARIIELSQREHGGRTTWLNEKTIKKDTVLVYREVLRVFGSVRQAQREAWQKMQEPEAEVAESEAAEPEAAGAAVSESAIAELAEEIVSEAKPEKEVKSMKGKVKRGTWGGDAVPRAFAEFYRRNGRWPTGKDLSGESELPSSYTVAQHGGFAVIREEAGQFLEEESLEEIARDVEVVETIETVEAVEPEVEIGAEPEVEAGIEAEAEVKAGTEAETEIEARQELDVSIKIPVPGLGEIVVAVRTTPR